MYTNIHTTHMFLANHLICANFHTVLLYELIPFIYGNHVVITVPIS